MNDKEKKKIRFFKYRGVRICNSIKKILQKIISMKKQKVDELIIDFKSQIITIAVLSGIVKLTMLLSLFWLIPLCNKIEIFFLNLYKKN